MENQNENEIVEYDEVEKVNYNNCDCQETNNHNGMFLLLGALLGAGISGAAYGIGKLVKKAKSKKMVTVETNQNGEVRVLKDSNESNKNQETKESKQT